MALQSRSCCALNYVNNFLVSHYFLVFTFLRVIPELDIFRNLDFVSVIR